MGYITDAAIFSYYLGLNGLCLLPVSVEIIGSSAKLGYSGAAPGRPDRDFDRLLLNSYGWYRVRLEQSQVLLMKIFSCLSSIGTQCRKIGFRYALPFFPQYHNVSVLPNETIPIQDKQPQPLITDGSSIRSLHLDLFYIEEPTVAFMNSEHWCPICSHQFHTLKIVNLGIETFMFSEFSAAAISKVWAGEAKLPPVKQMWDLHWQRLIDAGGMFGRQFMYLGNKKGEGEFMWLLVIYNSYLFIQQWFDTLWAGLTKMQCGMVDI